MGGPAAAPSFGADITPLTVQRIRPAYQQVADQLRGLIVQGDLAPGAKLPTEVELSAVFGVSRSTVREALRLLSSQGLIRSLRGPAGGTFVRRADPHLTADLLETAVAMLAAAHDVTPDELFEVRDLLEVRATTLAARHRTDADLDALGRAIEEPGAGDRLARFERHRRFHDAVMTAAASPLLQLMTAPIYRVIEARFTQPPDPPGELDRVDDDHRRILELIAHGSAEEAGEAMHAHLLWARRVYGAGVPTGGS